MELKSALFRSVRNFCKNHYNAIAPTRRQLNLRRLSSASLANTQTRSSSFNKLSLQTRHLRMNRFKPSPLQLRVLSKCQYSTSSLLSRHSIPDRRVSIASAWNNSKSQRIAKMPHMHGMSGFHGNTALLAMQRHWFSSDSSESSAGIQAYQIINDASELPIVVTADAVERIEFLREKRNDTKLLLRVAVDSGGCSGFQYAYEFTNLDELDEEDIVLKCNDKQDGMYHVVVDKESLRFLKGAELNYKEDLIEKAFAIENNPNAGSDCGCGISFTPTDNAMNS